MPVAYAHLPELATGTGAALRLGGFLLCFSSQMRQFSTGTIISMNKLGRAEFRGEELCEVCVYPPNRPLMVGIYRDCEDFILAIAGHLGAVNPATKNE